jgi:hypothetical protein
MMKNIGIESEYPARQGCQEGLLEETFWSVNADQSELETATNISGYYLRMIESYLHSFSELSKVSVKSAINKELEEDFSDPVVVVQRGQLTPHNIGVMNSNMLSDSGITTFDDFSNAHPQANYYDSKIYTELMSMTLTATIYGSTYAEVEKIGILAYNLLMASSYDAMVPTFKFIVGINPPTLSPVGVTEKHSEIYTASIEWSLEYRDDAILLIRKNVIKYATIMLRESEEDRINTVSSET